MTDEELTQAIAELQEVVRCRCDEAYRDRGLKDPLCECDSAEAVKIVADHIKALTEQLAAARQDAKEAEAYAEELEQERDDYAHKLMQANNTYTEMHLEIERLSDKLAENEVRLRKAVEALGQAATDMDDYVGRGYGDCFRETLAEIKGEKP